MPQARRGASPLDRSGETWNLLYRFSQHWILALASGVALAALGLLYAGRYKPMYYAEAQVRIGDTLDARAVPGQKEDQSDLVDLPETLAAGFRARFMVDPKLRRLLDELAQDRRLAHLTALRTEKGRDETLEHFKKMVLVEPVARRVFKVSYTAPDPDLAHIVVQRLAELGVADLGEERSRTARQAREFLSAETEAARQKMVAVEEEIVRFLRAHPKLMVSGGERDRAKLGLGVADKLLMAGRGGSLATQAPLKALELSTSPEVRKLMMQKAELEAKVAAIEGAQKFDSVQTKIAELDKLQQQILELKAQNYTSEYPEYRRVADEIERIHREIRDHKSRRDRSLAQDLRAISEAKAEIAALDKEIALKRRKAQGGDKVNPDEQVLSAEAQYARLNRDLESARTAYEKLRERELEAQVNEELSKVKGNLAARIEDPAKRPLGPRGVSRRVMSLICGLLGLALGICIGFLRALTDPLIYTVYDLAKASRLPVLGRVPPRDGVAVLSEVAGDLEDGVNLPARDGGAAPIAARAQSGLGERMGPVERVPISRIIEGDERAPSAQTPPEPRRAGDYMVVYSSPRTPPRGGAGSGTEAELEATTPLPVAVGDGARPMPAPALRTKSGLFTSPQSAAFRLAGMGHILHQGQLKEHPHLFLLSAPDGARAEQYRLLRCRLQDLSDPRVIVVTSAVRGEGKTMATANLALAYAEGGAHSVIMIDAHLATPQLTELCGAEARPEVLSDADLSTGLDIWQFMPNLFLVPALGQRVKRSAVLSSPAFAMLIADLRQTFDYIIIDSPAVASAADAKIVMRNADAGLFLTKARSTTGQQVRVALDRLGRGVMAGVVLNEFGV